MGRRVRKTIRARASASKKTRKKKGSGRPLGRIAGRPRPISEARGTGPGVREAGAAEEATEGSEDAGGTEGTERMAIETQTLKADLEASGPNGSKPGASAAEVRETARTSDGGSAEGEEVLELLAFKLADEEYAVDVLMIKEIIRSVEVTRVPRRPDFIKGIISLRGKVIPIFDLRIRLGLKESESNRDTRILVVAVQKGMIGVITDGVTEVVKVNSREIEPPPAVGGGSSEGHLKGVTRVNGRLIILLDLEKAVWSG
jgi:purine-binding chemotaxis protein CheW